MTDELDQVRALFRGEAKDILARMTDAMLRLEAAEPAARPELLRLLLREAHNIKGMAASLSLGRTAELAHALESALEALEDRGELTGQLDALHRGLDALSASLDPNAAAEVVEASLRELPSASRPVTQDNAAVRPGSALTGGFEAVPSGAAEEASTRVPLARVRELVLESGEVSLRIQGQRGRLGELRPFCDQTAALARLLRRELGPQHPATIEADGLARGLSRALAKMEFAALQDGLRGEALHGSIQALGLRPISSVFRMLPRLVRDLAKTLGKQVQVSFSGANLEVEKSIIDLLRDALMHLVRNALDHGIEPPEERTRLGKPQVAALRASARLEGAWLTVELSDDGRGVDLEKVKRAALRSGALTDEQAGALSPEQLQDLIFQSGVSTQTQLTDISGRGVGLDAVRRAVERAKGSVRVSSTVGQGATFTIQVPLRSHRTHVMIFRVGPDRLALPSFALWKVLRQAAEGPRVDGQPAVLADGAAVPVLALAALLHGEAGPVRREQSLLLVRSQGRAAALAVDELVADEEAVSRDPEPPFRLPPLISGLAARGDGELVPIVNPAELIRAAGVKLTRAVPEVKSAARARARRVLVVDDSFTVRALEKSILEMAGYEVLQAADGQEALELLARERPDAVVSDINMPRCDGFELLRAVRQSASWSELPFILVSSRASAEDRQRGLELGASAYVVKSEFDQELLLDAVARHTG